MRQIMLASDSRWARGVIVLVLLLAATWVLPLSAGDQVNLIDNGDFKAGEKGWDGLGSDADKSVSITAPTPDAPAALVLKRIKADTPVACSWQNLRFQPQTLYKLTVTGYGAAGAGIGLRPSSTKDTDYFKLSQSWATSSAPMPQSDQPATMTFTFDSGLKVDRGFLVIHLPDGGPMEYTVTRVALEAIGSSAPNDKEIVIGHIGDSFTASSYLPFDQRVDRLLQTALAAKFPGRAIRNVNLGVDGEYLKELTDTGRYEKAIHEQYKKFDILIIRYGANDRRFYKPEEFTQRLNALCDLLEKDYPNVKIVIGAGLWLKGSDANKQYTDYWQASRDLATARKYPLADLCAAFEKANADDLTLAKDNMHPSAKGVQLIAETEFATLAPLLEKK